MGEPMLDVGFYNLTSTLEHDGRFVLTFIEPDGHLIRLRVSRGDIDKLGGLPARADKIAGDLAGAAHVDLSDDAPFIPDDEPVEAREFRSENGGYSSDISLIRWEGGDVSLIISTAHGRESAKASRLTMNERKARLIGGALVDLADAAKAGL